MHVCVFSHVPLFAIPWTVTWQAPLSMGFPKKEYWSWLPFPSSRDLPNPGIKPLPPVSPALAGRFFTTKVSWKDLVKGEVMPIQEKYYSAKME